MTDTIWHYTSMEALRQITRNRTLFFSNAAYLNDFRELTWVESILENALSRDDSLSPEKAEHLSGCILSPDVAIRSSPFVASFSTQADKLSQWRAYADDGKGVAIGFGKEWLHRNIDELYTANGLTVLRQVVEYLPENASSTAIYEAFERICEEHRQNFAFAGDDWPINIFGNYFLKNAAFQEEEEYRICYLPEARHPNAKVTGPEEQFRTLHNGRLVPYVELSLAVGDSKLPITGLILGPRNVNPIAAMKQFFWKHGNLTPTIELSKATYRR